MAGTAAFDRKDYKGAVDYWERLRVAARRTRRSCKSIAASIDEARKLGGLPPRRQSPRAQKAPPAAMPPPWLQPAAAATQGRCADAGTTVGGTVNLSDAIKAKAAPTDTVFIFARAAEGSRMPLALTQVKVSELPAEVHARRHDGDVEGHDAVDGALRHRRRARVQVRTADAVERRSRGALQACRGRHRRTWRSRSIASFPERTPRRYLHLGSATGAPTALMAVKDHAAICPLYRPPDSSRARWRSHGDENDGPARPAGGCGVGGPRHAAGLGTAGACRNEGCSGTEGRARGQAGKIRCLRLLRLPCADQGVPRFRQAQGAGVLVVPQRHRRSTSAIPSRAR